MSAVNSSNTRGGLGQNSAIPLKLIYKDRGIYLYGFQYELGEIHRSLAELKREGLICCEPESLASVGYGGNYGISTDESLKSLAKAPFSRALQQSQTPSALVFHHSYSDNVAVNEKIGDPGFMSRVNYFPPLLMREFELDHVPYLVSFASGCTGIMSLIMTAAGLCGKFVGNPIICTSADIRPPWSTFDALREKILTSDCSSSFLMSREKRGYELLGISYYSTVRQAVPLVEIVKRSVSMIRDLAKDTGVDLSSEEVVMHYPNIFPSAWDMISNYLRIPRERHVLDEIAERAHCLSSDSMISLAKYHGGQSGRVHIVLNFGSGLHLGACILREEENP